jgi:hypothetical protein
VLRNFGFSQFRSFKRGAFRRSLLANHSLRRASTRIARITTVIVIIVVVVVAEKLQRFLNRIEIKHKLILLSTNTILMSLSSSSSSSSSSSESSTKRIELIKTACNDKNLRALRILAITGGLENNATRQLAWPLLVGLQDEELKKNYTVRPLLFMFDVSVCYEFMRSILLNWTNDFFFVKKRRFLMKRCSKFVISLRSLSRSNVFVLVFFK